MLSIVILNILMLNAIMRHCSDNQNAQCHYSDNHNAERHITKCHNAECRHSECRGARISCYCSKTKKRFHHHLSQKKTDSFCNDCCTPDCYNWFIAWRPTSGKEREKKRVNIWLHKPQTSRNLIFTSISVTHSPLSISLAHTLSLYLSRAFSLSIYITLSLHSTHSPTENNPTLSLSLSLTLTHTCIITL